MVFGFLNVARALVPVRIGLTLATVPLGECSLRCDARGCLRPGRAPPPNPGSGGRGTGGARRIGPNGSRRSPADGPYPFNGCNPVNGCIL